jgi:hypothetical protein
MLVGRLVTESKKEGAMRMNLQIVKKILLVLLTFTAIVGSGRWPTPANRLPEL